MRGFALESPYAPNYNEAVTAADGDFLFLHESSNISRIKSWILRCFHHDSSGYLARSTSWVAFARWKRWRRRLDVQIFFKTLCFVFQKSVELPKSCVRLRSKYTYDMKTVSSAFHQYFFNNLWNIDPVMNTNMCIIGSNELITLPTRFEAEPNRRNYSNLATRLPCHWCRPLPL